MAMTCEQFRQIDLGASVAARTDDWAEHLRECAACSNWHMARKVVDAGYSPDDFPCVHIAYYSKATCAEHARPPEDCADNVFYANPEKKRFGIRIPDGGDSYYEISYCPWCGIKLHKS